VRSHPRLINLINPNSQSLLIVHSRRARQKDSLHPGAGTIKPEIISSLMTGGSDGGGGHTRLSIISSVTRMIPVRSGGSVLDDRIIMQRPTSSCRTLSKYIISKSLTMAPLITMISSPLMIPERKRSTSVKTCEGFREKRECKVLRARFRH